MLLKMQICVKIVNQTKQYTFYFVIFLNFILIKLYVIYKTKKSMRNQSCACNKKC